MRKVFAGVVFALALAAAGCGDGGGDDESATTGGSITTVAEYRPEKLEIERRIALGGEPGGVAYGYGSVWIANVSDNVLLRVDPDSAEVVARIKLGRAYEVAAANGVDVGEGSVWASDPLNGYLLRIDPETNAVASRVRLTGPSEVVVGHGAAWVLDGHRIVRVDAETEETTEPFGEMDAQRVGIGKKWLWVFDSTPPDIPNFRRGGPPPPGVNPNQPFGGLLVRVDPKTYEMRTRTRLDTLNVSGLAIDDDAVWFADRSRHSVTRVDPATARVLGNLQLPLDATVNAAAVALGDEDVWFTNAVAIVRIDPETNAATGVAHISKFKRYTPWDPTFKPVGYIAVANESVWVADPTTDTLAEVEAD